MTTLNSVILYTHTLIPILTVIHNPHPNLRTIGCVELRYNKFLILSSCLQSHIHISPISFIGHILCVHWHYCDLVKVRSYYTAIVLRRRYIDYISVASHHSITAFQVKMNLTSCDTAQCSNIAIVCRAATQRNCGVVWTDLYHTCSSNNNTLIYTSTCSTPS